MSGGYDPARAARERAERERRDAVILARDDITDPEWWEAFGRAVTPGLTAAYERDKGKQMIPGVVGGHPWGCSHP